MKSYIVKQVLTFNLLIFAHEIKVQFTLAQDSTPSYS